MRRMKYEREEGNDTASPKRRSKKTALMAAVDILARQEQSEKKLREKLARKGYEDGEIQRAVDRLVEMHYLNDAEACARQFAFLYEESRSSVRQICVKLMQRGFDSGLVRDCIPPDSFERETQAALRVLSLRFKPSADQQKMKANLYSKGFDSSVIRAAVDAFAASPEH